MRRSPRRRSPPPPRRPRGAGKTYGWGRYPSFDLSRVGTFSESKSAPIHRWFQYPAGFSFRAVEYALDAFGVGPGSRVYDPFTGTGTTEVTCKGRGVASAGTEAHPFVAHIARTKVRWDYDLAELRRTSTAFVSDLRPTSVRAREVDLRSVPELLRKCYSPANLRRLCYIRDEIRRSCPETFRDLFEVALVGALRRASGAATGWPYISPKHQISERDGLTAFVTQLEHCVADLESTPPEHRQVPSEVAEGDARASPFATRSFDLAMTSPPYLNNYDYADRTRLETYFFELVRSWGEISERVRSRLIVSATTQVARTGVPVGDLLSAELKRCEPSLAVEIQRTVDELSRRRRSHRGRKSYDLMVGAYFNDMTQAIRDTRRVLRPGSRFVLILGDSAPYGVHIPTETYLGRIAVGLGFEGFEVHPLRVRGGKWRSNPQRHQVPLRESVLVLQR